MNKKNNDKLLKYLLKPYMIYTVINLIFMFLSNNNIGIFNEDTFGGFSISWLINSIVTYITIITNEDR